MRNIFYPFFIVAIILQSCGNFNKHKIDFQFAELETNTDASLRGLFVVDENVIWASGSKGTVLLSIDGGKNWSSISEKGFYTFRVVPDKLMGFVAGGEGKIARVSFMN